MQNLKEELQGKVFGSIYKEDIQKIVEYLTYKMTLQGYITGVIFSEEEFKGVSYEDAVDYDEIGRELIFNKSVIASKFVDTTNNEDMIPYNWMVLFREIFIALEQVKFFKYKDQGIINDETIIIKTFHDFIEEESVVDNYSFLRNYKANETTRFDDISDPIERIKSIHAYYHTLEIFEKLRIPSIALTTFKDRYQDELLKGYTLSDQGKYPLRSVFFRNTYLDGLRYMSKFKWFDNEAMVALSNATNHVHSVKERLALGYPIDFIEYQQVRSNKV